MKNKRSRNITKAQRKENLRKATATIEACQTLRKQTDKIVRDRTSSLKDADRQALLDMARRMEISNNAASRLGNRIKTSDTIGVPKRSKSVMDADSLKSESKATREDIILKSRSTAPLYNKGPTQFITPGTDKKDLGK